MTNMADPEQQARYDRLVYDGARFLAETFKELPREVDRITRVMSVLTSLGATYREVKYVVWNLSRPDYTETSYRGAMLDEGVVESLKSILRRIHFPDV